MIREPSAAREGGRNYAAGDRSGHAVVLKHPARYFLVESAETGVGSRFRVSRFPCGRSLAENDSRPPRPHSCNATLIDKKRLAGCLFVWCLRCKEGDRTARVKKHGTGLLVDLSDDGRPIGIEIAIPSLVTAEVVNRILEAYGLDRIDEVELAPLKTAA